METQSATILTGYSEREKGAYLAALASLSTADRQATPDEVDHLREMAKAAGLSPAQEEFIVHAAIDMTGEDLKKCLDVLKTSDLKYSLITDLIALAKADESYSEEEKTNIERISEYLGLNNKQVSVLDEFVSKAATKEVEPEQVSQPGFMESLGLKKNFADAGLNIGSMGRGLMGVLGPLVLGGLAAKALGGNRGFGRRATGGLGGMLGGGMLGGGLPGGMGGLGSLINGINRSRNNRSLGGLLGRII
jgi:uncharacterized tellurite resistance protein B-like protein